MQCTPDAAVTNAAAVRCTANREHGLVTHHQTHVLTRDDDTSHIECMCAVLEAACAAGEGSHPQGLQTNEAAAMGLPGRYWRFSMRQVFGA